MTVTGIRTSVPTVTYRALYPTELSPHLLVVMVVAMVMIMMMLSGSTGGVQLLTLCAPSSVSECVGLNVRCSVNASHLLVVYPCRQAV